MKDKYIDLIEQSFDFPQDEFTVEDNELNFHDIPLMELIKQYGTPLKITYLPKISQQINRAKRMFNVADACVNIGIVLLAIWMVFFEEKDKQHAVYRWGAPKAVAQTEGGNHDPSDSKEKNEDADTAPDCR